MWGEIIYVPADSSWNLKGTIDSTFTDGCESDTCNKFNTCAYLHPTESLNKAVCHCSTGILGEVSDPLLVPQCETTEEWDFSSDSECDDGKIITGYGICSEVTDETCAKYIHPESLQEKILDYEKMCYFKSTLSYEVVYLTTDAPECASAYEDLTDTQVADWGFTTDKFNSSICDWLQDTQQSCKMSSIYCKNEGTSFKFEIKMKPELPSTMYEWVDSDKTYFTETVIPAINTNSVKFSFLLQSLTTTVEDTRRDISNDNCENSDEDENACDKTHTKYCLNYDISFSRCYCEPGYEGDTCSDIIEVCTGITCLNKGTCSEGLKGASPDGINFNCECQDNWNGQYCETDVTPLECSASPALICDAGGAGSGRCIEPGVSNTGQRYCACKPDDYRTYPIDGSSGNCNDQMCEPSTCQSDTVPQIGTCTPEVSSTSGYSCTCLKYKTNAPDTLLKTFAELKLDFGDVIQTNGINLAFNFKNHGDDCELNSCDGFDCMNGYCVPDGAVKSCHCANGWEKKVGQIVCSEDIDECTSTPCLNSGSCKNLELTTDSPTGFECVCEPEFSGELCENTYRILFV